ncbi:MAG TPA: 2-C-methyl-D-erythritol 2,4-cyclodiphosphate synthase [Bacilli bacterium]|jgi:2-C-methyl-D-erythritol 2,4-cyclodiphosphate synthase|nr:2-C-methyl-D-erythritol 2,4-cyclodiphosphate synthase [Bacilli bacterium]MDD4303476.1 2-C-methyl-D-erythritol 2,4-cyclodiphosphate synthase [Bacilli bacterium]NLB40174.1 2-C-methyl-D-erythritol 2,4-cyclodiphosphate synthase [Erysipelotrichaceae bacterium]HPV69632.1 2-C-methyl-D-erythritol 2,4-cyclodiphosphate synthase [Bacilli bacterium]HPY37912.1 2-C-methyl-D-erythritol 2,4-cyclodiphosphate synthase [Bacilli bacterium]
MYRIGYGEDIHRLVAGRKLILGGVEIPFEKGLLGHSDADIVIHALMDALLGALSLGDIGTHFPDADKQYKNVDSMELLNKVNRLIEENGYAVKNIDISIALEKPRLSPYLSKMVANLARSLRIMDRNVSIKAMTNEGLDAVGRGEAARAVAVVMLQRK